MEEDDDLIHKYKNMYAYASFKNIIKFILSIMAICILAFFTFKAEAKWPVIFSAQIRNHESKALIKSIGYLARLEDSTSGKLYAAVGVLGFDKIIPSKQSVASISTTTARSVPVLLYHGITEKAGEYNETPDDFFAHLSALKKAGYQTITLRQFKDFIEGKSDVPDRSFLLTFDDARDDSVANADPVLRALGFTAVMFVPTEDVLRKPDDARGYYFNVSMLRNMIESGRWEIGSHAVQQTGGFVPINRDGTYVNFLSNKRWLADQERLETDEEYTFRIQDELTRSRAELEELLGIEVYAFSYPFSDYGNQSINNPGLSEEIIRDAVSANYEIAFRQTSAYDGQYVANYRGSDPYMLKRIEPKPESTPRDVLAYLDRSMVKDMPYQDVFSADNGWKNTWGYSLAGEGALNVRAASSTSGGLAILDGSYLWTDYIYTVNIDRRAGSHVSLITRYKDNRNFVACSFSDAKVDIAKVVNRVQTQLISVDNPVIAPKDGISLGMMVQGDSVSCYEGNKLVAKHESAVPVGFESGGVGIQVWDENRSVASGDVTYASVYPYDLATQVLAELPKYDNKPIVYKAPKISPTLASNDTSSGSISDLTSADSGQNLLFPSTPLPYSIKFSLRSENSVPSGWIAPFGELSIKDLSSSSLKFLRVEAASTTGGVLAVYEGGRLWKDYIFNAKVDWGKGNSFDLVVRYSDPNNYVTCSYSDKAARVYVVRMKDGKQTALNRSPDLKSFMPSLSADSNVGAEVAGDTVTCTFEGSPVVRERILDLQPVGSIGFKAYDKEKGKAYMHIRTIDVF